MKEISHMRRTLLATGAAIMIAATVSPVIGTLDAGVALGAGPDLQGRTKHPAAGPVSHALDQIAAQFALEQWVRQLELNAAVEAYRASRSSGTGVSSSSQSDCGDDFECFKACTLEIESGGNYGAVSSSGTYRGAWQFDQQTWDSNAAASGRDDLVGQDPAAVDPGSQDQVAAATYSARGSQPWGGRC